MATTRAQEVALKTNLLGWASTSANAGIEIGTGKKTTCLLYTSSRKVQSITLRVAAVRELTTQVMLFLLLLLLILVLDGYIQIAILIEDVYKRQSQVLIA